MNASVERDVPVAIGPFRIVDKIGEGGMGVVYRARHETGGQVVALKTVRHLKPRLLGAIRAEISALRAMRHPGVVRIAEQGLADGLPWYAMELLEGATLSNLNKESWVPLGIGGETDRTTSQASSELSVLPIDEALSSGAVRAWSAPGAARPPVAGGRLRPALTLYRRLCEPLTYLHARGVVHRDLKPSNIFVRSDGTPVLVDFGLISYARGAVGREILGSGGRALGTLSYVAPEQLDGQLVDARADLYSLGCMLYETLTGRPPFVGPNVLEKHRTESPVPLSELVTDIPARLESLVLGLLAKRPQDRIGYASDVAAVLCRLLGEPVEQDSATDGSSYLYRPQLAGRSDLLTALDDERDLLANGRGGMLLFGGESGIGKTFLLAEFVHRANRRGLEVVTGEGVPLSASLTTATEFAAGPLHPLRRLFQTIADRCRVGGPAATERLLGRRAALLAPYEPALARFAPTSEGLETGQLPPDAARDRLLQCLIETLVAVAAEAPLVLVLDDLQWADDLTLALLSRLTPDFMARHRLLLVGAYRSEEVNQELAALLAGLPAGRRMGRLEEGSVKALVSDMLALNAPPPSLIRFLTVRSEGNPFFVAEYLRLLVSERVLSRHDRQWRVAGEKDASEVDYETLPMPRSLQGLLARRLSGLPEATRTIITTAAILGREFEVEVLTTVVGGDPDQFAAALREAVRRQVIEETDAGYCRFSHDKLRETAYGELDAASRRTLHAAVARVLEARYATTLERAQHYPDLAHHFVEAGDTLKAIEYLEKAGEDALSKSANREAATYLTDALELAREHKLDIGRSRTGRWHRQIGDALQGLGDLGGSARHLRQASRFLNHPAPVRRARLVGSLLALIVRQVLHRLRPRRFLGSLRHRSEALLQAARTHDRLQNVLYYSGDAAAMLHACMSSLNLAELAERSTVLTLAYTNAHAVAGILPARSLAERYYRLAVQVNDQMPDPTAECYLRLLAGGYRLGLGDWDQAKTELERGLSLAEGLRFQRRWEELKSIMSIMHFLEGQLAAAVSCAEAAHSSSLRGDFQIQCWGLVDGAQALLVQDRLDQAHEALGRADVLATDKQLGRMERMMTSALLGRSFLRAGDRTRALAMARRALAEMKAGPSIYFSWIEPFSAVAEVFVGLSTDDPPPSERQELDAGARAACAALGALARLFPAAAPKALLWEGNRAWGRGRPARAHDAWRRGLDAARRLRMPYDEGLALLALNKAAAGGDDKSSGLDQARKIFSSIGAGYGLRCCDDAASRSRLL